MWWVVGALVFCVLLLCAWAYFTGKAANEMYKAYAKARDADLETTVEMLGGANFELRRRTDSLEAELDTVKDTLRRREVAYDALKDELERAHEELRAWKALDPKLGALLAAAPVETCGLDFLESEESPCEAGWMDALTEVRELFAEISRK